MYEKRRNTILLGIRALSVHGGLLWVISASASGNRLCKTSESKQGNSTPRGESFLCWMLINQILSVELSRWRTWPFHFSCYGFSRQPGVDPQPALGVPRGRNRHGSASTAARCCPTTGGAACRISSVVVGCCYTQVGVLPVLVLSWLPPWQYPLTCSGSEENTVLVRKCHS